MGDVHLDPSYVPETHGHPPISAPQSPAPYLEHLTVTGRDIFANTGPPKNTLDIELNADYVRIITDLPIVVWLDGRIVTGGGMGTAFSPVFMSNLTDNAAAVLGPAVDFEVMRSFKILSLSLPDRSGSGQDLGQADVLGQVEIYYGRGPVRALGPGWPVSFDLEYTEIAAPAGTITTTQLFPTLTGGSQPGAGNNALSPAGFRWFPHRLQIVSWSFFIHWQGPVGAADICRIMARNLSATRDLGLWAIRPRDDGFGNDPTVYNFAMSPPVEIPGYVIRPDQPAGLSNGLILQVTSSANMTQIDHVVNFRGFY